ncbi:MAG TPA: FAD-dependent oxidoreductase [Roseiarcus sp.]|nr:FAD-dependent oxidoreductase [Roseiarcus sp.]
MFVESRHFGPGGRLSIAVVGSGISGLSAAWLLASRHQVTVFEAEARPGGHSLTVETGATAPAPVDMGFIVYNEETYPNLAALFAALRIPTAPSEMSFAVSLDDGRLEYSGTDLGGLVAQKRNLVSPRFWAMLADLIRFYRQAPRETAGLGLVSLNDYLDSRGYGRAFREDHLYPMAAAIWSAPPGKVGDYPAAAFASFCANHGLLKLSGRPLWRTVVGGSKVYVGALCERFREGLRLRSPVRRIRRGFNCAYLVAGDGEERYDAVVIATHADEALRLLADPSAEERRLLGAFSYSRNLAVLHADDRLMPRRREVWSSWNYLGRRGREGAPASATYWMNRLQSLPEAPLRFVTLNPFCAPRPELVIEQRVFHHPIFDAPAIAAQDELWSLQGRRGTWFCGAYFGAGFHEDGLQAGLAVAESVGGVRRPWRVGEESGRIKIHADHRLGAVEVAT